MTLRAKIYVTGVLCGGVAVTVAALATFQWVPAQWPLLLILLLAAIIAQLNKAEAPNHTLYYATPVFLFAGALLLDPALYVVLAAVPHLAEWARERWKNSPHLRDWYLQPFNIAKHLVAGFVTHALFAWLVPTGNVLSLSALPVLVLAGLSYMALNQLLLGLALVLARDVSWNDAGVFKLDNVLPEVVMVCLGANLAAFWQFAPWLIITTLVPLALVYRTMMIPKLKQDANTDAKTGLYNVRYFNERYAQELSRAIRFERPLSLIMCDLDYLRDVNNTYGHLAGDMVLEGVGTLLKASIRDCDIACRFGGEEFCLLLLETDADEAYEIAERLRRTIEMTPFTNPTGAGSVAVTMSMGIATYMIGDVTPEELLHTADLAVYRAKERGRNQVICATEIGAHVRMPSLEVSV